MARSRQKRRFDVIFHSRDDDSYIYRDELAPFSDRDAQRPGNATQTRFGVRQRPPTGGARREGLVAVRALSAPAPLLLSRFVAAMWFAAVILIVSGCDDPCYESGAENSAERWRADLECVEDRVCEHPDPFTILSEDAFESSLDTLFDAAGRLTDAEMTVELSRLLARLGDAHTGINLGQELTDSAVPLQLSWFGDDLAVTNVLEPYGDTIGGRVIAVEGVAPPELHELLLPLISRENDAWALHAGPALMTHPRTLAGLGIAEDESSLNFEIERVDGRTQTLRLEPIFRSEWASLQWARMPDDTSLPLHLQHSDRYYWLEYVAEDDLLFVQYNLCAQDPVETFASFRLRVLEALDVEQPHVLVLDLRYNIGGREDILWPLIDDIAARPDIDTPTRFFVVIGRNTFSSAVKNTVRLANLTNATFVGEPTGGRPASFGDIMAVRLPYSRLRMIYSTKFFESEGYDGASFLPDVEALPSLDDFRAATDTALNLILGELSVQ